MPADDASPLLPKAENPCPLMSTSEGMWWSLHLSHGEQLLERDVKYKCIQLDSFKALED